MNYAPSKINVVVMAKALFISTLRYNTALHVNLCQIQQMVMYCYILFIVVCVSKMRNNRSTYRYKKPLT